MKVPASVRYTGFYDLLCDAVFQYRLAKECSDSYRMNRHARASISAAVLALECAANCLLGEENVPAAFVEDLDKLPLLSKYEGCLRISDVKAFDRGRVEVQKVAELVKVRNEFVHPKIRTIRSEIGELTEQGEMVSLPLSFDGEIWPALKIPKRPIFWSADSAIAVLAAVVSFLFYVLVNLKNLTPEEVRKLLLSRVEFGDVTVPMQFDEFIGELKSLGEYGIDLTFLGCSL